MVNYFLTIPGLYYLIGFIIVLSLVVYWQRKPIKRELRRWRGKEMSVGPVKFERQSDDEEQVEKNAGVNFGEGSDFTGAKIKRVAGRDILESGSHRKTQDEATPGVDFGKKGNFNKAEIEDIAGRDLETGEDKSGKTT